jgi:hypothetical protein
VACLQIRLLQFFERRHEHLRHISATIRAEMALRVWGWGLGVRDWGHVQLLSAA